MSDIKLGDAVILTKSIYDDGEDHHPPGYIAYMGETVYVKQIHGTSLAVAHEGNTGAFIIREDEYKRLN